MPNLHPDIMANMFMSPLGNDKSAGERKCWMGRLLMIKSLLCWGYPFVEHKYLHVFASLVRSIYVPVCQNFFVTNFPIMFHDILSFAKVHHTLGKGSSQTSWELWGKSSKLTLIPKDPNVTMWSGSQSRFIGREMIPSVVISLCCRAYNYNRPT